MDVLRVQTLAGIDYFFTEMEIGDVKEWLEPQRIKQRSQFGDPHYYALGVEHYNAEIEFILCLADTISRLNLVRLQADRFWIYPHYLVDQYLKYCVVLDNPQDIAEFWRRGLPLADEIVRLRFQGWPRRVGSRACVGMNRKAVRARLNE